jgi:predicted nucleic acid-binding protein
VICLDSSVALARLLTEERRPEPRFWDEQAIVSSRLLEYEIWNRLHARRLGGSHGDHARRLLARVDLVELAPPVLARALEPFPVPPRTLDALHLAAMAFMGAQGRKVTLASYDARLLAAAKALGIESWPL